MSENGINLNICYGCMRPLPEGVSVCPSCRYDNFSHHNTEDTLPEGSVLNGKYLVGRILGRGGFGVTYLGYDLNLQLRVAIKEYFPLGASYRVASSYNVFSLTDAETTSAFAKGCGVFLDEAQTLARFNSLYIVHVREFFREHGTAYIIMDYVDGITVTETVKAAGGKLPLDRVLSLMEPLIQQLDKLHEKNIIHRDIKPDNIMVVQDDFGKEHAVLLDFGAARSFISGNVTKNYTAVITPGFAPLEQYSEISRQGPYTDVYAICATMYYMLTGKIPTPVNEQQINSIPIKPFSEIGVRLPAHVEKAIMHGLALKSTDRTQTMQQLSRELAVEQKKTKLPEKTEQEKKTSPRTKRKPRISSALVIACIFAIALIGTGSFMLLSGSNSGPEADYRKATSLMQKGEYQEAEGLYESLGEYKDSTLKLAEARYFLGLSYETGNGVKQDDRLAVSYYQLAADEGYTEAVNKLGECAYYGKGIKQDYAAAFEFFEEASDQGSVDALYNLGLCYETGHGTKKDEKTAMAYYRIAADNGNANALDKVNG